MSTSPIHAPADAATTASNATRSPSPRFHTVLREFMTFVHQRSETYPKEHVFPDDELTPITPQHVCDYLSVKAYGKQNAGVYDKLVITPGNVDFQMKAINYFMPHNDMDWNDEAMVGNPVKSAQVKLFMNKVKRAGAAATSGVKVKAKDLILPPETGDESEVNTLLRKMHAQNAQFINIFQTMDSSIKTMNRSIQQMRSILETNNIEIKDEIMSSTPSLPPIDPGTIVEKLKEDEAGVAQALHGLMNENSVHNSLGEVVLSIGIDGYATFISDNGKALDLPEGFELPTCELSEAWKYWFLGFQDYKYQSNETEQEELAPIRPVREMKLSTLPPSLKKKFKDGWRPALQCLSSYVEHMVNIPTSSMNDNILNESLNAAMTVLLDKAPALFEGKNERSKGWKVSTWSRKIREQQLSNKQVEMRRQSMEAEALEDAAVL
jgi:hypothetical protein